jgi:hypothetical protein
MGLPVKHAVRSVQPAEHNIEDGLWHRVAIVSDGQTISYTFDGVQMSSLGLATVAEARAYMLALSKDRELRSQWQRAAELLLAEADVADFSKQVELALFYDAKFDVSKIPAR